MRPISDSLRLSPHALEGLHILQMSATNDWLVRRDITIELSSTVHADQTFEADVDMDRVLRARPRPITDAEPLVWIPILQIPSNRPTTQRVTDVYDGNGNRLPIMPQATVRHRLSAALSWLYLSGAFRLADDQHLGPDRVGELELLVENAISQFLSTRDSSAIVEAGRSPLATGSNLDLLRPIAQGPTVELGDGAAGRIDERFAVGLSHCFDYVMSNYFAVVGVEPTLRTPHIRCRLLPAELELSSWWFGSPPADHLLGFDDGHDIPHRPSWLLERVLTLGARRPSLHYLRFPVPEMADLTSTHLSIIAEDDVCLNPAVLHHDHVEAGQSRPQSRDRANGDVVTSSLASLAQALDAGGLDPSTAAVRAVAGWELTRVRDLWANRSVRLREIHRLADKTLDADDAERPGVDEPTGIDRVRIDDELPAWSVADGIATDANELLDALAEGQPPLTGAELIRRLERLGVLLEQGAHVEMIADDDPRDHVAHFHATEVATVFRRSTDNRPVVHAIVRPSRQAREGFMQAATFTCGVSSLLLTLVLVTFVWPVRLVDSYDASALVALLLLVPGIGLTLLERVSGDTLRYLVVGRSIRWSQISLVPPIIAAILFATAFSEPLLEPVAMEGATATDEPAVLAPGAAAVGDVARGVILALLTGVSWIVTTVAHLDRRRHQDRFDYRIPVGGTIVQRGEEVLVGPAREPADDDPMPPVTRFRSTVDTRTVGDICRAALFQANRPSRRFMVAVVVSDAEPGGFHQIIGALEGVPDAIRGTTAGGDRGSTTAIVTEATVGLTLGGAAAIMAMVSCDPEAVPVERARAASAVAAAVLEVADPVAGWPRGIDPIAEGLLEVTEIVNDHDVFFYRTPRYVDAIYEFPAARRHELLPLLQELAGRCDDQVRISYLDSLTATSSIDGASQLALKVGLAIDGEHAQQIPALLCELQRATGDLARLIPLDRRAVADRPRAPEPPRPPREGLVPAVLVSAGPRSTERLQATLDVLLARRSSVVLDDVTVLTTGSYACQAYKLWVSPEVVGPGSQPLIERPEATFQWFGRSTETVPAGVGTWATFWIRWQLRDEGGRLARLLEAVDRWQRDGSGAGGLAVADINLEYLTNRLDERGLIGGKARYRFQLDGSGAAEPHRHDEVRRALELHLDATAEDADCFVVVRQHEPRRPFAAGRDDSEFSPY